MRIAWTFAALLVVSSTVSASTNQYLKLSGYPQHGYIEIPADTVLDSAQMTVEGWVSLHDATGSCSSIAGNGYTNGWWLGVCGGSMRSYFNGTPSQRTGGNVPLDAWVHVAAVTDGTTRKHYINGNLVLTTTETARLTSTRNVRIGSDPDWDYQVAGAIDDLRVWSVARTQDQIRQTMFISYSPAVNPALFLGLEAWYAFEGNANDSWHTHHGTITGNGVSFEQGATFTTPNQVLKLPGYPQTGYIEIPADPALDTPQMTVEAWVSVHDAHNNAACSSIAGNGFITGWWLGICGTTMRSYFNGSVSQKSGGTIPVDTWVHIAAVTDGTTRRHYINGQLVFQSTETAPASTSTKAPRIGSDPDWDFMVAGEIDDLRIWSVARTQVQIQQTMFVRYSPQVNAAWFPSLEAWYAFEGDAKDSWHTHNGTINGTFLGFDQTVPFTVPRHRGVPHH